MIQTILGRELPENDHTADSVRKFSALTAEEEGRRFLDKSELIHGLLHGDEFR